MQQFANAENGHLAARNERVPQVCARMGVVEGELTCDYIACESELRSYLCDEISNSIPQPYCSRPGARATEDHPGGVV